MLGILDMKFRPADLSRKLPTRSLLVICSILILNPPINEYWSAICVSLSIFCIVFFELKRVGKIWLVAFLVTSSVLIFQNLIPRMQVEEGHQFFVLEGEQEVYKRGSSPN